MRMRAALLVFSLVLTGCGGVSSCGVLTGQQSVAEQAPDAALAAKKSLTVAHLALEQVGETLIELAQRNVLVGQPAATAKQWYDRADDALKSADSLEKAANTRGVMEAIKIAEDALFQANEIVKSVR